MRIWLGKTYRSGGLFLQLIQCIDVIFTSWSPNLISVGQINKLQCIIWWEYCFFVNFEPSCNFLHITNLFLFQYSAVCFYVNFIITWCRTLWSIYQFQHLFIGNWCHVLEYFCLSSLIWYPKFQYSVQFDFICFMIISSLPVENGRHFADDIFKYIFVN